MTDLERIKRRIRTQIKAAHNESSDFAWLPVGTCQMILDEFERLEKKTEEQEERIAIMTEGKEGTGNE